MRKIYKLFIGIMLSAIAVACSDKLDSDKYFKDRRSLEDVFTDKESTEEWLANAYSYLGGYNLEVSNMLNTITNFAGFPISCFPYGALPLPIFYF